jgi:hypothetical protein
MTFLPEAGKTIHMRSQKSRSRGKSRNNNNNNRPQGNVVNRVFDSSGPEGKVRGTPQQIIDKYQQLHRDATLSNDRVAAENFAQHAEHYTRMLGEAMREQEARREAQEAQQRERQKEREEQHAAKQAQRDDRQQNHSNEDAAPENVPQPDVIELDDGDSGLVETVENTPKPKKPRTRKPRVKPSDETPQEPETDQPAAE